MNILVTGGAGYIGSHFVKRLILKNFNVIVLDNLSRGHLRAIHPKAIFEKADLLNEEQLHRILSRYNIDTVVHFAAFAYVGESVENPSLYYTNNVVGSLNLIKSVVRAGIKHFIFSSTCSVYGDNVKIPIDESQPVNPMNPYAQTKLTIEKILHDFERAYGLKYVALRYFNAAGADALGSIGESHDPETHLIPIVLQTALGLREKVLIFGNDYPTRDGTCIRDYVHVEDLAEAHLLALEFLLKENRSEIVNLGTGNGNSVSEIIDLAREITSRKIPSEVTERRPGDPAILVADNQKAKRLLSWQPRYNIKEIISSAWQWHKNQKF